MARTVREASLATRSARLRLSIASKPYWRVIEQGLHLGYRRRATGGSWIARRRNDEGIYREAKLASPTTCKTPTANPSWIFARRKHRLAFGAHRKSASPPARL
jgi:hypothetical protein